jgi:glycosyltransferase involved in cell wall biosynthesis
MTLSIIIPAHNEEPNIEKVIRAVEKEVQVEHETVVVNDHSTDRTAEIVKRLSAEFRNLRQIENREEAGFANALRTGFKNAAGDMLVPVMADLCDEPHLINKMYALAGDGFDIVCGSRYMPGGRKIGGPALKSFFSRLVGVSLHALIGIPTHDISNSFKLYRKKRITGLGIGAKGFEVSVEIPLKAFFSGAKITEIPTTWQDRKEGESKFDCFKQGPRYLRLYLWAIAKKLSVK